MIRTRSRVRSSRWLPPALSARRRAHTELRPRAAATPSRTVVEGADPFMTDAALDEARQIGRPFSALAEAWKAVAALAALVFAQNATWAALVLLSTPVSVARSRLRGFEDIGHPGDFGRVFVRTLEGLAASEREADAPQPYRRAVARIVRRFRERFTDPAIWAPHVVGALLRFLGEDDSDLGPDALDRTLEALRAQNGGDRG